ncbi:unnamed protein product [Orchesella dallaii]|uniref:Uncharacterized protein n=1 Tax=Orchesella dallaii TaxID=48710 RepID=A0ABP1PPQ2_9HEXA
MTTTSLRDLAAYVSQFNYTTYYEKVILRNCPVVIDGCDLMQFLFLRGLEEAIVEVGAKDKNPKGSARKGVPNPHWFGGDWETYARNVRSFFQDLKKCEITPIVIMDGALSTIAAMKEEAELHEDPLDSLRLQGYPGKTYTPVFLKRVES